MAQLTRRELIENTAAGLGMTAIAGILLVNTMDANATPLGLPIGSQSWPTRSMLRDFPSYCKQMADIGVRRLELCSPLGYGREFASLTDPKETKKIMADHGIESESSHFTLRELRTAQEKSLDWANEIGIKQVIVATLSDGNGGSTPTMDQVKRAAEEYNKIAEVSAKAGMRQGLHNEGFEMATVDGKRSYDVL